jgi:hypothetical protein
MKPDIKIAIAILALTLFTIPAFSQKYYARLGGGYNLNLGSGLITTNDNNNYEYIPNPKTESYDEIASESREGVYGSFGKGLNVSIAAGVHLKENILFELGFNYLSGATFEGKRVSTAAFKDNGTVYQFSRETKYYGRMFSVTPALVLNMGHFGSFTPYLRAGLIIGKGGLTREMKAYMDNPIILPDSIAVMKFDYTGKWSVGAHTALGVSTPLNYAVSFFAELNMSHIEFYPGSAELKEFTVNGNDHMSKATPYQKSAEFTEQYAHDPSKENSYPAKLLTDRFPFSSWGINVGILVKLPSKNAK